MNTLSSHRTVRKMKTHSANQSKYVKNAGLGLDLRTGMHSGIEAGNAATDACYAERNWHNLTNFCIYDTSKCYPHDKLKECLRNAGITDFTGWNLY